MTPDDPFKLRDQADPLLRTLADLFDWLELLEGLLSVLLNW